MEQRICRVCGELFIPLNGRQMDCRKSIQKRCKVCGKSFSGICSKNDDNNHCSKECRYKDAKKKREATYMKQTKQCVLCGKDFHPKTNTQVVCERKHFRNCSICGKEFEVFYGPSKDYHELRQTCSKDCEYQSRLMNCAFKRAEIRQKISETMLEKYGVEYPAQNSEIRKKMQSTTEQRYGKNFCAN